MPKQVWQADDGTIFDSEQKCQEYENKKNLLNDLCWDIQIAIEGGDQQKVIEDWGFSEDFFNLFDAISKEDLIKYKEDFRRLADCVDGQIPNY